MNFDLQTQIEWHEHGVAYLLRYNPYEIAFLRDGKAVFEMAFEDGRNLAHGLAHAYDIKPLKGIVEGQENAGQPWLQEQDEELRQLFQSGKTTSKLAGHFRRSKGGITARLVRLGLIKSRDQSD